MSDGEQTEPGVFVVEKLLDVMVGDDGMSYYLIRWKGYGPDDDTWEPETNILDATLIQKFNKERNAAAASSSSKKGKTSKRKTTTAASSSPKKRKTSTSSKKIEGKEYIEEASCPFTGTSENGTNGGFNTKCSRGKRYESRATAKALELDVIHEPDYNFDESDHTDEDFDNTLDEEEFTPRIPKIQKKTRSSKVLEDKALESKKVVPETPEREEVSSSDSFIEDDNEQDTIIESGTFMSFNFEDQFQLASKERTFSIAEVAKAAAEAFIQISKSNGKPNHIGAITSDNISPMKHSKVAKAVETHNSGLKNILENPRAFGLRGKKIHEVKVIPPDGTSDIPKILQRKNSCNGGDVILNSTKIPKKLKSNETQPNTPLSAASSMNSASSTFYGRSLFENLSGSGTASDIACDGVEIFDSTIANTYVTCEKEKDKSHTSSGINFFSSEPQTLEPQQAHFESKRTPFFENSFESATNTWKSQTDTLTSNSHSKKNTSKKVKFGPEKVSFFNDAVENRNNADNDSWGTSDGFWGITSDSNSTEVKDNTSQNISFFQNSSETETFNNASSDSWTASSTCSKDNKAGFKENETCQTPSVENTPEISKMKEHRLQEVSFFGSDSAIPNKHAWSESDELWRKKSGEDKNENQETSNKDNIDSEWGSSASFMFFDDSIVQPDYASLTENAKSSTNSQVTKPIYKSSADNEQRKSKVHQYNDDLPKETNSLNDFYNSKSNNSTSSSYQRNPRDSEKRSRDERSSSRDRYSRRYEEDSYKRSRYSYKDERDKYESEYYRYGSSRYKQNRRSSSNDYYSSPRYYDERYPEERKSESAVKSEVESLKVEKDAIAQQLKGMQQQIELLMRTLQQSGLSVPAELQPVIQTNSTCENSAPVGNTSTSTIQEPESKPNRSADAINLSNTSTNKIEQNEAMDPSEFTENNFEAIFPDDAIAQSENARKQLEFITGRCLQEDNQDAQTM